VLQCMMMDLGGGGGAANSHMMFTQSFITVHHLVQKLFFDVDKWTEVFTGMISPPPPPPPLLLLLLK
jgi:hypothetical protein